MAVSSWPSMRANALGGWRANHKRVERLWLNDGSCIRLRSFNGKPRDELLQRESGVN